MTDTPDVSNTPETPDEQEQLKAIMYKLEPQDVFNLVYMAGLFVLSFREPEVDDDVYQKLHDNMARIFVANHEASNFWTLIKNHATMMEQEQIKAIMDEASLCMKH